MVTTCDGGSGAITTLTVLGLSLAFCAPESLATLQEIQSQNSQTTDFASNSHRQTGLHLHADVRVWLPFLCVAGHLVHFFLGKTVGEFPTEKSAT